MTLNWVGDRRWPNRIMVETLEKPGAAGGKEKEWSDYVADDFRMFGNGEGWKIGEKW